MGDMGSVLEGAAIASRLGEWMSVPEHAERVTAEGSVMASGVLRALSDDDVQDVIEDLAREHLIAPEWGPPLGEWLDRIVQSGAHHGAVDLGVDSIGAWLEANRDSFHGLVSRRLPSWVPGVAHRFVDDAMLVAGGSSYFSGNELNRLYRDVLAGLFHPSDPESAHATVASAWLGPVED